MNRITTLFFSLISLLGAFFIWETFSYLLRIVFYSAFFYCVVGP